MIVDRACYPSSMKALALALLSACSVPVTYDPSPPDAAVRITIDAATPQNPGCSMGNLPTSRTSSPVNGDPVDPALIGEIEDNIIGQKFKSTPFYIPGTDWRVCQGSPTLDTNGLWTFQTSTTDELVHEIVLIPGTRITSIVWSINRNSNNTSGEFDLKMKSRAFGASPTNVFSDVLSSGTGFTARDSVASALAGAPILTVDGFSYWLSLVTTTTFSGAPTFDGVKIVVDRL